MTVNAREYARVVVPRIEEMIATQLPAIEEAGRRVGRAIGAGGRVWLTQTSHTIHLEGTHRAGGLMCVDTLEDSASIREGDVVIVGTSAGTSAGTIGLAVDAHDCGALVIALTSVAFEDDPRLNREREDGRVLHEVADITIDLGSPYGDGEFDLPGTGVQILPSTGATGVVALWMLLAEAVSTLLADGKTPLVWQSNLLPGGQARNAELSAEYRASGVGYVTSDAR